MGIGVTDSNDRSGICRMVISNPAPAVMVTACTPVVGMDGGSGSVVRSDHRLSSTDGAPLTTPAAHRRPPAEAKAVTVACRPRAAGRRAARGQLIPSADHQIAAVCTAAAEPPAPAAPPEPPAPPEELSPGSCRRTSQRRNRRPRTHRRSPPQPVAPDLPARQEAATAAAGLVAARVHRRPSSDHQTAPSLPSPIRLRWNAAPTITTRWGPTATARPAKSASVVLAIAAMPSSRSQSRPSLVCHTCASG